MKFRRRVIGLLTTLIFLYISACFFWRNGVVMAESEWSHINPSPEVKVRRLPSTGSFWALPLFVFPEESGLYRFEYYRFRSRELYSAQSFIGESFIAQSAKIVWDKGEAVVYLDDDPVFRCDVNGFWHLVK